MLNRYMSILRAINFRSASTLVIAEETGNVLNEATKSAISASSLLKNNITCLINSDKNTESLAKATSSLKGVCEVVVCEDSQFNSSALVSLILQLIKEGTFTHVVGGSSSLMKDCLARVSAQLGVSMLSEVTKIVDCGTFERRLYAGNVRSVVTSEDPIKVMTVRSFPSPAHSEEEATIRSIPPQGTPSNCDIIGREESKSERPSLTTAKVVVSGGRGLKTAENFKMVYDLADCLGGAVGATRAAVDAGFVSNDLQVGQTGKVVSPELYVSLGISGAIQHLAGMRDSRTVVAIDQNESAPIFQFCDYGIIGDLFEVVPQLTDLIRNDRS